MSFEYCHNDNKPAKEVLEKSIKKIKCPLCGLKTEPYHMKFHQCSKENLDGHSRILSQYASYQLSTRDSLIVGYNKKRIDDPHGSSAVEFCF